MRSMSSKVAGAAVRILSRHMVRSWTNGDLPVPPSKEDIHLTPWDLYPLTLGYIHKGFLLPKPKGYDGERLVDTLASSLSRALGRCYHFAGRLAVEAHGDGNITVSLRCTGEGAELVHAAAPGVAVADIVGSRYTHEAVPEFFPLNLNGVLNVDAAMEPSLPVPSAQVTELADGVFVAMSMNHLRRRWHVGNAVAPWKASCAVGEVMDRGLGWTAWQLNRGVASFDEAGMDEFLAREPTFACLGALSGAGAGLATGGSPRFDVFGNAFGWGKPLAVRGGAGNWTDGRVTAYEGSEGGGSMSLDVCLAPEAMERLVADDEFMEAVSPRPVD